MCVHELTQGVSMSFAIDNAWHMGAVSGRILIVADIFLPRKSFPEPVHSMTLQEWLPSSKNSTFLWNDCAYLYMGQRDHAGGYCNGGHNETARCA